MKAEKKIKTSDVPFLDENGKEYIVPEEGSLGLLALGYKGLMSWREKRKEAGRIKKIQKNQ